MLKEKISEFIDIIQSIEGAECALVSRDGIVAGKYFDRDRNEPWLGVLLATLLSSAESVGGLVKMKSLESIAIRAKDTSLVVAGAWQTFLIAVIIDNKSDPSKVHGQMFAIAKTKGESM